MIDIYVRYNTAADNALFEMKEYRSDVFVAIDGLYYNIEVITKLRFMQDLDAEPDDCHGYSSDIEQIIVKSMSQEDIISGIMDRCGSFKQKLLPCRVQNGSIKLNLSDAQHKLYVEWGWDSEVAVTELCSIYHAE